MTLTNAQLDWILSGEWRKGADTLYGKVNQKELGKMNRCKYCKSDKDVWIKAEGTNEIYLSKGKITAFCGWCGCYTKVKIKYCPMCGKKLGENKEENK